MAKETKKDSTYICMTKCFVNGHLYREGAKAKESEILMATKGQEKSALKYFRKLKTTEDFVEPAAGDLEEAEMDLEEE